MKENHQLALLCSAYRNPRETMWLRLVDDSCFTETAYRDIKRLLVNGDPITGKYQAIMRMGPKEFQMTTKEYAVSILNEKYLADARAHAQHIVDLANDERVDAIAAAYLESPYRPSLEVPMSSSERFELEMDQLLEYAYELPSAISSIQNYWGKLMPGAIHVIAAESGVGKSLLVEQIALGLAMKGHPVVDFTVEMPFSARIGRYVQHLKGANYGLFNYAEGQLTRETYVEAVRHLPGSLYVSEQTYTNAMLAKAEQMYVERGARVFVVDFVQGLVGDGRDKFQDIGQAMHGIYKFSKRNPSTWLVASQYNREGKKATRTQANGQRAKPASADLYGAMELETFAWTITHILADPGGSLKRNLYMTKNRFGAQGDWFVNFDPTYLVFKD